MPARRIPQVTVNCDCNKIELEVYDLNPEFVVCHCELCQLVHAGPGFGAHCSGIKIVEGAGLITMYKSYRAGPGSPKVPMAVWHFCSQCGTKLYYTIDDDVWQSPHDKYVLSVGILHGNETSKEVAKQMTMVREASYEVKPHYYDFQQQTDRLSTEQTVEYYKTMSQTDAASPVENHSWDTL
mgnify:CR=1 FL=1|jgi:hypothetical protein